MCNYFHPNFIAFSQEMSSFFYSEYTYKSFFFFCIGRISCSNVAKKKRTLFLKFKVSY